MALEQKQLNRPVAKKDSEKLVTKIEFDQKTDKIVRKIIEIDDKIVKIDEKMATKDDMNNVFTTMDKVMQKLDVIEHAFVSNQAAHDRFEQRITKIKQHLGLNQYDVINK